MGAQRAAWEAAFVAEHAAAKGMVHVDSVLDLVKAFEMVPHDVLIELAKKWGYPLWLLRLSLAAYRLARSIGIEGVFSITVVASRGITAGAGHATTELRILLIGLMFRIHIEFRPTIAAQLYIDDLHLAGNGPLRECVKASAEALQLVVYVLEVELKCEVSVKKSAVLASTVKAAKAVVIAARTKVKHTARFTKLLGTPCTGGRRRSTRVFKLRLKQAKGRVHRFWRLRRTGLPVAQMARTAITPAVMYGADIMGLADTALAQARSTVVAAAAPPGCGKGVDVVLSSLDGDKGTLDPAFDAHLLGLRHWAYAWWEQWLPTTVLEDTFQAVSSRLDDLTNWRLVAGPTAALLCSLNRIGWSMLSARTVVDNVGDTWDFALDSPAAILQAGHRAVRTWRLSRILLQFPTLVGPLCDAPGSHEHGTFILDFADVIKNVLKAKKVKEFPLWSHKHRRDLLSATAGGQWPQARRSAVQAWRVHDNRCQLCLTEVGTLAHREFCSATRPEGGWGSPPTVTRLAEARFQGRRQELLSTRGLAALRLPCTPRQEESFSWIWAPESAWPADCTWYIDGSMLNKEVWQYRATGFGVVVVSPSGGLVAFGGGNPPAWAKTAAAAEAWALRVICSLEPCLPSIRTDCKNLLTSVAAGAHKASGPSMLLARIWRMIAVHCDGDLRQLVDPLTWMPAHTSLCNFRSLTTSRGRQLTVIDWRANRLADAIAKACARDFTVDQQTMKLVLSSRAHVRYQAAKLGVLTHAANNHVVQVHRQDGSTVNRTMRDAVDDRPAANAAIRKRKIGPPAVPESVGEQPPTGEQPPCSDADSICLPASLFATPLSSAQLAKRRATSDRNARLRADSQAILRNRVAEIGASLRPSVQPSGRERLAALKLRVSSKL